MGFGVWVWCSGFGVWVLGFGDWGLGFGVWGLVLGVWGLGFGVSCSVEISSHDCSSVHPAYTPPSNAGRPSYTGREDTWSVRVGGGSGGSQGSGGASLNGGSSLRSGSHVTRVGSFLGGGSGYSLPSNRGRPPSVSGLGIGALATRGGFPRPLSLSFSLSRSLSLSLSVGPPSETLPPP